MAVPTSAFSITLSVRMDNAPGVLGRLSTEIGNIGGNITGVSSIAPELAAKRLALLKETVPAMGRVEGAAEEADALHVDPLAWPHLLAY